MARVKQHQYFAEVAGILISGLGMMLLIVISAWVATILILGSRDVADDQLGAIPSLTDDSRTTAFMRSLDAQSGQVAGVVDDASLEETAMRNDAANWLSDVREVQGLEVAYRDVVLDRNAQNHARYVATQCDVNAYSDWNDSIGIQVDEGDTSSFSESIFLVDEQTLASELPKRANDYSRLFTLYDAMGVGVAKIPESGDCASGFILVFHMAGIR